MTTSAIITTPPLPDGFVCPAAWKSGTCPDCGDTITIQVPMDGPYRESRWCEGCGWTDPKNETTPLTT